MTESAEIGMMKDQPTKETYGAMANMDGMNQVHPALCLETSDISKSAATLGQQRKFTSGDQLRLGRLSTTLHNNAARRSLPQTCCRLPTVHRSMGISSERRT